MQPLLTAKDLASGTPRLVLDTRSLSAYFDGHWPGATHLDIARWASLARQPGSGIEHGPTWAHEFGVQGIDGRRAVAVYDDGRMTDASRAWLILQWHGVSVQMLDGGWPALRALQPPLERGQSLAPVVSFRRPSRQAPRVGLVNRHTVQKRIAEGVQVLDVRTAAEHLGSDLRANPRGGHLPGAKWIAHTQLLTPEGRLQPVAALADRLAGAGVDHRLPVITHCDAGGRAALAALAAVTAGHREVSSYDLGYADWAADDSCPVVKA